ncbi:MAG: twin-arginine translocase TatA/TatE family subunit [Cohaesibacter sp.]|jgi:sec-independent protein translocase protein TatA|nr:twin-arginine translocase TatA/TatE family subunit [Cohaesibacter sp.]
MGQIGIWQIVIIAVVVVLLFGRGKISELMGDVAKGINSFKKGLKDEDQVADTESIEHKPAENVAVESENKDKASS